MLESVRLKQRLHTEHEPALAEQKGPNTLQKVKLHVPKHKCHLQSETKLQLTKELLELCLREEITVLLKLNPTYPSLEQQLETGNESVAATPLLISPVSRAVQTGDRQRPDLLSVKERTVTTARPSSPRQPSSSEMEEEARPAPRSKPRYTGQVRLCTARYSYNPYDGPNEHPEAELPLGAGKYLYIYGNMDDDGFYEGELLDGQRGLVPSNFVEFVQDKDKPATGEGGEDLGSLDNTSALCLTAVDSCASQEGLLSSCKALVPCSNGTGEALDPEDLAEDVVPYPRKINLIKQLARSVIVAWEPPIVPFGWGNISGYNVLVDGELRASIQYGGRTKSLLEKLDLDGCVHRVCVQCVTDRGFSDELRCTLLVGANVVVAPSGLRVDDIQRDTAELSWLPSNSNYAHTVFLDGVEHAVVKAGKYRLRFHNLKPHTVYKVIVVAQPHQVPWQLPLEQRERKEAGVEFCTQAAGPIVFCRTGPPLPPQDVQVHCGQAPGVLQVCWKPPILSPTGTSNGANVIGYVVCTKGQKIAEVMFPMADYVAVELNRIQCLEAREVIVRTLSLQGESLDSQVAVIPNNLLVPPPQLALPPPIHPHPGPPPHAPPHLQSPHLPHPQPQLPGPPMPHGQQPQGLHPPLQGSPHQGPHPPPQGPHPPPQGPHPPPQGPHPPPQGSPHQGPHPPPQGPHPPPQGPHPPPQGSPHQGPHPPPQGPHPPPQGSPHQGPHPPPQGPHPQPQGPHPPHQGPHPPPQGPHPHHQGPQPLPQGLHPPPQGPHPPPQGPHPPHTQPHPRLPHPGGHPHVQMRPPHPQPVHLQPHPTHQGPRPQHQLPLLPQHPPHPVPQRPVSARDLDAKDPAAHHRGAIPPGQSCWDPQRSSQPLPLQGHTLEAPPHPNPRSPSPQRILPQPRGTLIPDTVAKAIAREAAQRVAAESGKQGERRPGRFGEQGQSFHPHHSDEEEEDEEGFGRGRRRGPSVDEFLRGSELGRPPHYSHNEEYHSESSRGSDLSDIMEEDEEELYSEMQLEEGRRRNSHNTPKGNNAGRHDREPGRRVHPTGPQRRPLMVPSIEVTSENSEGTLTPITDDVYYGKGRNRTNSSRRHKGSARSSHDGYRDRDRRSPYYDESEPEEPFRIFVALFDYDPLSMSPNPDAADEELPFKEGQIIRIYGDKDTDGFYRGEVRGRMGLIPCNMVSEIRAEDEETMDQLIKQGFLPLSTPVDRIEHNRKGLRRDQASRRMVALYDYDPRESSPNVDVEAELTFCAGDILAVYGDIDEDGFYYGEMNGHRGLVPSNFLEEVPDDVEVYLTDTPSHYPQEEPANNRPPNNSFSSTVPEGKRVPTEATDTVTNDTTPVRAPSPIVRPLLPGTMRPLSPTRGRHLPMDPRDPQDLNRKKKGLLSKGKKLLKRLSPVK
ncbi:LOW QUALITY PROTEIN: RIMS-binding protein 2-like [Eucyclogobius newberryi]|uniref:LOW QUALITY PROTEIN: RIMS-binding protein 2-like n=1 Tax=Eucyclogobius newberryi TaxID=166745 RepID=UPI003B5CC06E